MTEKTPTLGSLETSDYTKRQLALQSLQFNLQNKIFVELFPELCDDIREKLKELQTGVATASGASSSSLKTSSTAAAASSASSAGKPAKEESPALRGAGGVMVSGGAGDAPDGIQAGGILGVVWDGAAFIAGNAANIFVILGFAVFAYTVRYVLGTVE